MKEKLKMFLKNNIIFIVSVIFVLVFTYILSFDISCKLSELSISSKGYFLYFYALLTILLIIYNYVYFKRINDTNYSKIFLLIASFLGIFYLVLSPLFTGSDEHNHYYRIYEISEGIMVTPTKKVVGSILPSSLENTFVIGGGSNTIIKYRNIKDMIKIPLESNVTKQYGVEWTNDYSNTALYSPVQYLPHTLGFMIAKLFKLSPYYIGMFGRVFNLISYLIIGYLCIKILPKYKLFYLAILLSPNMIQCATTLSADAFTNVIFMLILALIYKIKADNKTITKSTLSILSILCIVISLCKIVYLPIVFLVLLISKNNYKYGKKEKYIYSIILILLSCFVSLYWMNFTKGVFVISYDKNTLQKAFIFKHLFEYFSIFLRTISTYFSKYVECLFVGTTMYHSQVQMPSLVSWIYVIIVAVTLFLSDNSKDFKSLDKWFISIIAILIMGLISTAIYVQCTAQYFSIAHKTVEGIQGRYFLPVIMLLPFICKTKSNLKVSSSSIIIMIISINNITILHNVVRVI